MAKKKTDPIPKKKAAPSANTTPVDSIKHKGQSRPNIPTRELAGFAAEDEAAPRSALYPRDPSLDPQLVWKGKDEQDRQSLEVPAVPIYIQEKIQPQAIIEDLRQRAAAGKPRQLDLFADFNGLDDFATKVDFYHHDQHWTNRMILGDSLLVMTSLAEKERLKGRVQMIYLDPPYGIRFGSNWQVSTRKRDVKDAKAEDATRQPEQIKAFRDTWEYGIHSYLTVLRDRLAIARDLLTDSGSIFVQIGDENVHLVRSLLDEVFGSEHFCTAIVVTKTYGLSSPTARVNVLSTICDYVLWYAKDIEQVKYRQLYIPKRVDEDSAQLLWLKDSNGTRRRLTTDEKHNPKTIPTGSRLFRSDHIISAGWSEALSKPFIWNGKTYTVSANHHWKTTQAGLLNLTRAGRLQDSAGTLRYLRFVDDFPVSPLQNVWDDVGTGQFTEERLYVVQTSLKVVQRCILMSTDPGDLVLDPTCGSGTTAYVAEQWGRRCITIDTSRVALALARTRLMAAKFPYYLLADSPEGRKKEAEITGTTPAADAPASTNDIRRGFVYKRVPHVTLKSIANNGGKERRVPLHPESVERTEAWLDVSGLRLATEGPLFRSTRAARGRRRDGFQDRPLTRRAVQLLVQLLVQRYVRWLKLDPAVTVHSLRVSALTTARAGERHHRSAGLRRSR